MLIDAALLIQKHTILKESSAEPLLIWPLFLKQSCLDQFPCQQQYFCPIAQCYLLHFPCLRQGVWNQMFFKDPLQSKTVYDSKTNAYSFIFTFLSLPDQDVLCDFSAQWYLHCYRSHNLKLLPSVILFTSVANDKGAHVH